MTRPRGRPPMPSATSSAIEPVGITCICVTGRSPSRMTEPLPNCLSICARARPSAFSRSGIAAMFVTPVLAVFADGRFVTGTRYAVGPTKTSRQAAAVDKRLRRCGQYPYMCTRQVVTRRLSELRRNPFGVGRDDRPPHGDRRDTGGEGLLDRLPAESGKHLVVGDAPGVAGPEDLLEPRPEVSQPHPRAPLHE